MESQQHMSRSSSQQRAPTGRGYRGRGAFIQPTPHVSPAVGGIELVKHLENTLAIKDQALLISYAENERLRLELSKVTGDNDALMRRLAKMEEENARLKAVVSTKIAPEPVEVKKVLMNNGKRDIDAEFKSALAKLEAKVAAAKALEKEYEKTETLKEQLKRESDKVQDLEAMLKKELEQKRALENSLSDQSMDMEILQTLNVKFQSMFKDMATRAIQNSEEMEGMVSLLKEGGLFELPEDQDEDLAPERNAVQANGPDVSQSQEDDAEIFKETKFDFELGTQNKPPPTARPQSPVSIGSDVNELFSRGCAGYGSPRSESLPEDLLNAINLISAEELAELDKLEMEMKFN